MELALIGVFCTILGFVLGLVAMKGQPNYSSFHRVKEFHKAFGHPVAPKVEMPGDDRNDLRVALIAEELDELREAVAKKDLVAIADALGDLDYVVNGAALEYGIFLPAVTAEIHRSNMTKLGEDGKPIYREDGKILKGPGYENPRLAPILFGE